MEETMVGKRRIGGSLSERVDAASHPEGVQDVPVATNDATAPALQDESPDERQRRIREAAYARYVRRGGVDGHDVEDWLAAELEVDGAQADGAAGAR
jgi:hypothetical protein